MYHLTGRKMLYSKNIKRYIKDFLNDSNIPKPIATLNNLSTFVLAGRSNGNIIAAAKSTVIKGIPLQNSTNAMQKYLMTGNSDLFPNANKTPKGNAKIIPKKVNIKVNESPPQTLVSTFSKPNPPWIKINPITGKIKIKKNKKFIKLLGLLFLL